MRQKLSIVLLTYNEQERMEECLRSVRWADEIVVMDSGSTDKTKAICKKFKVKFLKKSWQGFGKQRDDAVKKAKHDWILSMDADERVTPELAEEIKRLLKSDPEYKFYRVPFKNMFMGYWMKNAGMYPDTHLRLFDRRHGGFNHNPIHEWVITSGPEAVLKNDIRHLVCKDLSHYFGKINRYTDAEAEILYLHEVFPTGYDLFLKPLLRFFNTYVARRGYRDGVPGFLFCFLKALYFFLVYLKLYEKRGWKPSVPAMLGTVFKRNKTGAAGYPSQAYAGVPSKQGDRT